MKEKNKKNMKKTTAKKTNNNKAVAKKPIKKTVAKPANNKKVTNKKKVEPAKVNKQTPKAAPKKVEAKKVETKKVEPKKVEAPKLVTKKVEVVGPKSKTVPKPVVKEQPKKVEPKKEEPKKVETKEEKLEKTMIFDGTQRKNLQEVVNKLGENNVVLKDKVIKRKPINKYIIYALSALICITIIGTTLYTKSEIKKSRNKNLEESGERLNADNYRLPSSEEINDGETIKEVTPEINYSNITNITLDEFEVKLAEGEKMFVLISSETCYFSVTSEPIMNKILSEKKIKMYRLDITLMDDEETERLRNYYSFTVTPTTLAIADGAIISEVEGTQSEDEFGRWIDNNNK